MMVNRTIPKMAAWVVSTVMTVFIPTWVHADKQISTYYEGVGSTPVKLVAQVGTPYKTWAIPITPHVIMSYKISSTGLIVYQCI